jgi:hypothetical protein
VELASNSRGLLLQDVCFVNGKIKQEEKIRRVPAMSDKTPRYSQNIHAIFADQR